jgi:hypothetical protein
MDATDDDASKCRSTLATFFDGDGSTREDVREAYGECRLRSIGVTDGVALFVVWPLAAARRIWRRASPHCSSKGRGRHRETHDVE